MFSYLELFWVNTIGHCNLFLNLFSNIDLLLISIIYLPILYTSILYTPPLQNNLKNKVLCKKKRKRKKYSKGLNKNNIYYKLSI